MTATFKKSDLIPAISKFLNARQRFLQEEYSKPWLKRKSKRILFSVQADTTWAEALYNVCHYSDGDAITLDGSDVWRLLPELDEIHLPNNAE